MPELPEVETMRRGVAPIIGGRIDDAARVRCPRKLMHIAPRIDHFRRRVVGRRIDQVSRLGKRIVVSLDSGDSIVIEPRMTGLALLCEPPDTQYLRFRMDLIGPPARRLWYWDRRGLGRIELLSPEELAERFGPERLGPDALAITTEQLRARLHVSRRAIKVALLDQRALAGVGNLYASEILHRAGVHPATRCDRLGKAQWRSVHTAMRTVLEVAIRYEGSTLADGTYRNALNRSGRYQNQHRVYDRAGQRCEGCDVGRIERIVQAQRSTFYCPICQKRQR